MAITDPASKATEPSTAPSRLRRLAWLVLIWLAGVASLALVAGGIRLLMNVAGLSSH